MDKLAEAMGLGPDDGIFFAAGLKEDEAARLAGLARPRSPSSSILLKKAPSAFAGSSISMFNDEHENEDRLQPSTHLHAAGRDGGRWRIKEPLDILAWQYDIALQRRGA